VKLITSAWEEILVLYSTAKAFYKQDKLGAIVLIEQMAIQHGVKVRFLTPASEWVKQQAREVGKYTDIRIFQIS